MKTIVTTAGRPDEQSIEIANELCEELGYEFEERKKRSIKKISEQCNANVIVAGKNRYEYYPKGTTNPFFFHPNSAAYRLKRIARGESEPFLEACKLQKGDTFLDCTLGIGSDAIVAAFVVGKTGKVIGLEADKNVAYIVRTGMKQYDMSELPLTECMRTIEVIHHEAVEFLKKQEDASFDVVYMDPMFEEVIEESNNFEPLRNAGSSIALSEEWVNEAYRVAKNRVVLKAHFQSQLFERFGFERIVRLTSKFHFGVLNKNG